MKSIREFPGLANASAKEIGLWLYENGFIQTSRKYCMVGRLPPGTTDPCELLAKYDLNDKKQHWSDMSKETREYWVKHCPEWAYGLGPQHAGEHWITMYAQSVEHCSAVVLPEDLYEFRKLGGGPNIRL